MHKGTDTWWTIPAAYHGTAPGLPPVDIDYGSQLFLKELSSIDYSNSARSGPNPCFHWRYLGVPINPSIPYSYGHSAQPGVVHTNTGMVGVAQNAALLNQLRWNIPTEQELPWRHLATQAWGALRPSLAGGLSAPNFIYELRDVKRMFDLWSNRRNILRNFANGHLNFSFGWAPFIGDVRRIHQLLQRCVNNYEEFAKNALKPHKRHYKLTLDSIVKEQHVFFGSQTDPDGLGYIVYLEDGPPIYRFTVDYTYAIKPDPYNLMKGCLDQLGIRKDAQIIWDALPYSFIVDWFLNVGNLLHRMSSDNLDVTVEILSCCHSVKWSGRSMAYWRLGSGPLVKIASISTLLYKRELCDPTNAPDSPDSGTADLREFALIGSLIVMQKWDRFPHRLRRLMNRTIRRLRPLRRPAMRFIRISLRFLAPVRSSPFF